MQSTLKFNYLAISLAPNSDPTTPAIPFDWKMAQEEVMRADLSNDPIQAAIARLERQVLLIE